MGIGFCEVTIEAKEAALKRLAMPDDLLLIYWRTNFVSCKTFRSERSMVAQFRLWKEKQEKYAKLPVGAVF